MQMKRLTDHPTQGGTVHVLRPHGTGETFVDDRPPSFMQQSHLDLRRAMEARGMHDASWLCISFSITGPLDRDALTACFTDWARRHEVMQGWFVADAAREIGYARHAVRRDDMTVRVEEHAPSVDADATHAIVDEIFTATCSPFDDFGWVAIAVEQPDKTIVYLGLDHMYFDGFSALVAFFELTAGYDTRRDTGSALELPPVASFVEHAAQERARYAELSRLHPAVRYWAGYAVKGRGSLGSFPMPLGLQPGEKAWLVPGHYVLLDGDESRRLEAYGREHSVNAASLVYAAFAIAARDLTGDTAYRFLNPIHTRGSQDLLLATGWLVNLLPVHIKVRKDEDLVTVAGRVKTVFKEAQVVAEVPVVRVAQLLQDTLRLDLKSDDRPAIVSYLDGRKIPGHETWAARDFYGLTGSGYDNDVNVWVNRTDEDTHATCSVPDTPESVTNVRRFFDRASEILRAAISQTA